MWNAKNFQRSIDNHRRVFFVALAEKWPVINICGMWNGFVAASDMKMENFNEQKRKKNEIKENKEKEKSLKKEPVDISALTWNSNEMWTYWHWIIHWRRLCWLYLIWITFSENHSDVKRPSSYISMRGPFLYSFSTSPSRIDFKAEWRLHYCFCNATEKSNFPWKSTWLSQ